MTDKVDVIIIGAGVIGLAIAARLAAAGREAIIVEKETLIGSHTSSRNSEVIHAGIYYPPGSLKARLCLEGRDKLYEYCRTRNIDHRQCGKLIVATNAAEQLKLETIKRNAEACGVNDLEYLDAATTHRREPELTAISALWSPLTGILDSHTLMHSLLGDAENAGATLALDCKFSGARSAGDDVRVTIGEEHPYELDANLVINCAGLDAPEIARKFIGLHPVYIPDAGYARGTYFVLAGKSPFQHLIYPIPVSGGLGVHVTLDLAGRARFGPDVEWIDTIDYKANESAEDSFRAAISRYWPGVIGREITASYTGIRPKIVGPGEPAADFKIEGPEIHGFQGLINLFGIESPGLTASLAIADHVAEMAHR